MDTTPAEATRNYFKALSDWDLEFHKAVMECETADQRKQAGSRFIVEHEEDFRRLNDLKIDYLTVHDMMNERDTIAGETIAEQHVRRNDLIAEGVSTPESAREEVEAGALEKE